MKTYIDLTNVFKKYKGKWIVLDSNLKSVITHSTTARKAYDKAIKKGFKKPTLFKVPQKNIPYFNTPVVFSNDISDRGYGILGQQGFFNLFKVKFDFAAKNIQLKINREKRYF